MAKQDDGLFLLEVLVDKVVFLKSPCFSDKDFRTCVNIQCPAVDPLEICDDDPGSCFARSGGPFEKSFNSGKSCLFSLQEADISKAMSNFPIKITVYKSLPCGCLPTKIVMGEATIDMTKEFVQARKKFLEDPTSVSYEALKDSFRLLGPDKTEAGEIMMFLRISCFGKLIITRFQGGPSPPNLTAGGGSSIVDRSCFPRKDYQTIQDPCVCGAAKSGAGPKGSGGICNAPCKPGAEVKGFGVCPPAKDPYNSMPCEEPDDPCYCTGPKPQKPQQMVCRNTHQYCLHVPKGAQLSLPFHQDLKQNQIMNVESIINKELKYLQAEDNLLVNIYKAGSSTPYSETVNTMNECLDSISMTSFQEKMDRSCNLFGTGSKSYRVSYCDEFDYGSKSCNDFPSQPHNLFGKEEIVFMTLLNDLRFSFNRRTSGTQATASVNKCLQVSCIKSVGECISKSLSTGLSSSTTSFPNPIDSIKNIMPESMKYSDVYYYERNKNGPSKSNRGMGFSASKTKCRRPDPCMLPCGMKSACGIQAKSPSCTSGAQTRPCGKAVSIKDDKCPLKPCPVVMCGGGKSEMMATVSHVRIGPKESCPVYGTSPCMGPNCMLSLAEQDAQAPVKVTNVTNPRRGVFEIVIRKLTGAPLARNELMLEWTPPSPCRPPLCDTCTPMCSVPPCRPSKCKMIICRPCRLPKCCRKKCKPSCGPPCRIPCSSPCKMPCGLSCKLLCGLPCGMPCGLSCKKPCRRRCKRPCKLPCRRPCRRPCRSPCKSPCRSPCPSICRSPCRRCRSPCKPLCGAPCRPPYRPPCSPPICKLPCSTPCRSPCRSTCGSPCTSPCRPLCSSPCGPPCGSPCGSPCGPPCGSPCGPTCKVTCIRPRCRRPCRYKCRKCCKKPPKCKPCSPPCKSPCGPPSCCKSTCQNTPCPRPCPVGYKRPRKCRSQPKMKPHRKRISPCNNRVLGCAMLRCRSGPCIGCCPTPCLTRKCSTIFYCPSRKCCSVSPC